MWYTRVSQLGGAVVRRHVKSLFLAAAIVGMLPLLWGFACFICQLVLPPAQACLLTGLLLSGGFFFTLGCNIVKAWRWVAKPKECTSLEGTEAGRALAELCDGLNMPENRRPVLYHAAKLYANADAERVFGKGCIRVGGFVLKQPPALIKATLAHELGHIRHNDAALRQLCLAARDAVYFVANFCAIFGFTSLAAWIDHQCNLLVPLCLLAVAGVGYGLDYIGKALWMAFSREREYLADAASAAFVGWENRGNLLRMLLRFKRLCGPGYREKLSHKSTHPTWRERAFALQLMHRRGAP